MEKNAKVKSFEDVLKVNVNKFTEKKNGLTYLTWSHAWAEFKKLYPSATYEVVKQENGAPYHNDAELGIMVNTKVTVPQLDLEHEMWLPVMDGFNKAMRTTAYDYMTRAGKRTVAPATMFDVNKTIMRCLVKNLAMFGLGLYIYSGEDLPETVDEPTRKQGLKTADFNRAVDTIKAGKYTIEELEEQFQLTAEQTKTIVGLKAEK